MKRFFILFVTIFAIFTLCACGGNTNSESQKKVNALLAEAEDVLMITINGDVLVDIQTAEKKYCDKVLNIQNANVKEIFDDYVFIGTEKGDQFKIEVYLPQEEIENIEIGQLISIVGRTSSSIENKNDRYENGSNWKQITMNDAYISQDRYVVCGILEEEIDPGTHCWSFSKKNSDGLFSQNSSMVYFGKKTDAKELKPKSEMTIDCKKVGNIYKDAEIISVK